MTDVAQEEGGDLKVVNNDIPFVNGIEEVQQLLRQRLRAFLGEWFLNTTIGMPFFQQIFLKNPNSVAIEAAFKNEILNTPGILELSEFELDIESGPRQLTVTFSAISTDGLIDFSEILVVGGAVL